MEYETTQPREVYKTRLAGLWPEWPVHNSQVKIDFYEALTQCDIGAWTKMVNTWVKRIQGGTMVRWAYMFVKLQQAFITGPVKATQPDADLDEI